MEGNKVNLKKVIYPKLFEKDAYKTTKDKKRQNFRLVPERYTLSDDSNLYLKVLNKDNKIDLYNVPYEYEKISLFKKFHDIIDHFSKFMMSYPVKTNEAINALLSIKEFCLLKGMPTIL